MKPFCPRQRLTNDSPASPAMCGRSADRLESWFEDEAALKERLDQTINRLWEQAVITIAPLLRLVEEGAPEAQPVANNVYSHSGTRISVVETIFFAGALCRPA